MQQKRIRGKAGMNNNITTFSGQSFNPVNPDPDTICIEDIAHALSLICRANGHVKIFWSVGQHCINCSKEARARGLSDRLALACLLHDASECYLSDVPSPFKRELPAYKELEDRLLNMVYEKFLGTPLTEEEERELKAIDEAMLWYDLKNLLDEDQTGVRPRIMTKLDYRVRPFEDVEKEYLELFELYSDGLQPDSKGGSNYVAADD